MTVELAAAARRVVVVGVDGSQPSIEALRWGARIAAGIGAEIDAVISWDWPMGYGMGAVGSDWRPDTDAASVLDGALTAAFGDTRPEGFRGEVREGYAAKVLLDASHDAEMLVVGSRGYGGFVGLMLGSVSAHCAEHAAGPVLVVHAATEAEPA